MRIATTSVKSAVSNSARKTTGIEMTLSNETILDLQQYLRSQYDQARENGHSSCGGMYIAAWKLQSEIYQIWQQVCADIVNENEEPTNVC